MALALIVWSLAGFGGLVTHIDQLQQDLVKSSSLQHAELYTQALAKFRELYTSEVVAHALESGVAVTHDYAERDGAIPLPATLSMLLGREIGELGSGAETHLYSPYPFPWRKDEGLSDEFRVRAWTFLNEHPGEPYYRFEQKGDVPVLRYATADLMRASCVNCHNTHPDTPKSGWKEGDVRGVLEIVHPMQALTNKTRAGLRGTVLVFGALAAAGALLLLLLLARFQRDARRLTGLTLNSIGAQKSLRLEMDEKQEAELALRLSELRHRTVLTTMADGHAVIGDQGLIESANPALESLLGYAPGELVGRPITLLIPDSLENAFNKGFARLLRTGESTLLGTTVTVEALHRDGTQIAVDLSVAEMKVGERRLFSGILRDIRERQRVERLKSEFVSTVSHELRTPLTSIRGALTLLTGGAVAEFEGESAVLLDVAHRNSERLLLLVNDILDMQKIASGEAVFRFADVDLASLATQATRDLESFAAEHGVTFELVCKAEYAPVCGDASRLLQVLTNLMSNAAKFSPWGATVEVCVVVQGERVRVSVTDRGPGIPEDFQPRLFERFTQSDVSDTRQGGGTGLGLTIVKQIVERHGGLVGFVTGVGVGTTFFFDLCAVVSSGQLDVRAGPATDLRAPRVLIVEDDVDAAIRLRMILSRGGFGADVAPNAQAARRMLEERTYRALVLDDSLLGEDGESLDAGLRAYAASQNVPAVGVSRTPGAETADELNHSASAIRDWLQETVDGERLLSAVEHATPLRVLPTVLHVEDDADIRELVCHLLEGRARVTTVATISRAKGELAETRFDLSLLNMHLPDGRSGLDLLDRLGATDPPTRVVIYSVDPVDQEIADKVAAVWTKGRVTRADLADRICEILGDQAIRG